jgi:Trk K+ transport system NAD-binding subunit
MVGAVYVLAAATVDVHALRALWPAGVVVVIGLMVLVRPAVVHLSARGSDLTWRERTYVGLIGPRGVVAAAIAALAGERVGVADGGATLTALVFLTIAMTVAVQSTYAGVLARWLEVRAMKAVIAGSGRLARRLATQLTAGGFDVTLVDQHEDSVARARAEGFDARIGDATSVRFLRDIEANRAQLAVGATDSDQANLLFCQYVRAENPEAQAFARVHQAEAAEAFRRAGVHAVSEADAMAQAFMDVIGTPVLHDALSAAGGRITLEIPVGSGLEGRPLRALGLPERVLVLLVRRNDQELIPHGNTVLQRGDRMLLWGTSEAVMRARASLVAIE